MEKQHWNILIAAGSPNTSAESGLRNLNVDESSSFLKGELLSKVVNKLEVDLEPESRTELVKYINFLQSNAAFIYIISTYRI